jgi:hypothetical protein
VPTNISNISDTFFPLAASSFFKKTMPAIALTPPPSKEIIFFRFNLLGKKIRKYIHWNHCNLIQRSIHKKRGIEPLELRF